jgi:hypothetical protein
MIVEMHSLVRKCEVCGKRADFEIERTNDELPSYYFQHGVRSLAYCKKHLPEDAKTFWNDEIPDFHDQQL